MCVPWSQIFFLFKREEIRLNRTSYTVSTSVCEWFQLHVYCQGSNMCLINE